MALLLIAFLATAFFIRYKNQRVDAISMNQIPAEEIAICEKKVLLNGDEDCLRILSSNSLEVRDALYIEPYAIAAIKLKQSEVARTSLMSLYQRCLEHQPFCNLSRQTVQEKINALEKMK